MNDFMKFNRITKPAALLVLFIAQLTINIHGFHAAEERVPQGLQPVGPTEYRPIETTTFYRNNSINGGVRRRLAPFQLCLLCKCCSGATCVSMPCCFGIDCQLPNKPFGVCAFVPRTCNCTSCAT